MKKNILIITFTILIILIFGLLMSRKNDISFNNIKFNEIPDKSFNDVVLINQNDDYSCATTSLAMIISEYLGLHTNPLDKDVIWEYSGSSISTIKSLGNDLEGLFRICNKFDIKYEFIQNLTNEEVEYLLSKRIYLVAFIRITDFQTHAIALTGYDKNKKVYYANDPNGQKIIIPYKNMDQHWNSILSNPRILSDHGALVVYPENVKIRRNGLRG